MSNEDDIRELRRRVEALETEKKGWSEYRELVLSEMNRFQTWLEQLSSQIGTQDSDFVQKLSALKAELTKAFGDRMVPVEAKVNTHANEIGKLGVKAGVWGLLAGAIPAAIALIWWIVESS